MVRNLTRATGFWEPEAERGAPLFLKVLLIGCPTDWVGLVVLDRTEPAGK